MFQFKDHRINVDKFHIGALWMAMHGGLIMFGLRGQ